MKHQWITRHASNYPCGSMVEVTGGRLWTVKKNPKVDTSGFAASASVPLVFTFGSEVHTSIKSRKADVAIWSH